MTIRRSSRIDKNFLSMGEFFVIDKKFCPLGEVRPIDKNTVDLPKSVIGKVVNQYLLWQQLKHLSLPKEFTATS